MCWTCFGKATPKVAKEDIPIYKIGKIHIEQGRKYFYSVPRNFRYEFNKKYRLKWLGIIPRHIHPTYCNTALAVGYLGGTSIITKGFHSYTSEKMLLNELNGNIFSKRNLPLVEVGYSVVTGIIPKGTIYYEDLGIAVSEAIWLTSATNINDIREKLGWSKLDI